MKSFYSADFRLGILGGGQLGRMLIQEAINYDVRTAVLDPSADAPCSKCAYEFTQGDFNDFNTVYQFGRHMDVLTIEIEHVNLEALERLENEGVKVYPSPHVLRIVKDKGLQKQFYKEHGIATAPFFLAENRDAVQAHLDGLPFMQKLRTGGYDGRGVMPLRRAADIAGAFDEPSVLESMVDFQKEISIIIARDRQGRAITFPAVEMEFNPEANLVEFLFSPAEIEADVDKEARRLATMIAEKLDMVGILAVEMFVDREGKVLVNEIAPRPHNSGHHTIEACVTSQYEQHLRCILGIPLGDTSLLKPAVMVNLLGEKGFDGPVYYEGLGEAAAQPGVHIHLYGKSHTRPFRKMGHVTCVAQSLEEAKSVARTVLGGIRVVSR